MSGFTYCEHCGCDLAGSPIAALDWSAFSLELRLEMAKANLSLRQLAALIHVNQATIHRVSKHAKPVSAEAYVALRKWINAQREVK